MTHDVVLCSLNDWFVAYQTFEPTSEEISACAQAMHAQQQPAYGSLVEDGRLVEFRLPPSRNQKTENEVFKPLKAITDRLSTVDLDAATKVIIDTEPEDPRASQEVVAAAAAPTDTQPVASVGRHSSAHWSYDSRPNSAIPGEHGGSTNRIDGYFYRMGVKEDDLCLGDVAVICEYKKKTGDAVQASVAPNCCSRLSG